MRHDDAVSREVIEEGWPTLPQLKVVEVNAPGVVHALNSGLAVIQSDVIAITDDDAAPRRDWIERLCAMFAARPEVGGVGGRDWVHHGNHVAAAIPGPVGRMSWYGRCIGNHHLGCGSAREVHFLKGVNMSYRREAIGGLSFDTRLRGSGAQVCNDMAFSIAVRRRGWVLIYDPDLAVDHYPSIRHDEDRRNEVSRVACENAAFNQSLTICETLGRPRAAVFLLWSVLVGTRGEPGMLQMMRLYPSQRAAALVRTRATIRGVVAGWSAAAC
jgi:GT2 family glycosyltransferase